MAVRRFDIGRLDAVQKLDNGWVRAPAAFTRAGIFVYRNPDGTERRELRHPDDVFHADSLASLSMVPLTNEHPPALLDATNASEYAVGSVGDTIRRDGQLVRGNVMVTDAKVAGELLAGRKSETSCGYSCELSETPGLWEGAPYDARQSDIRYNHVALVPVGRAGRDVRVKLDAADGVMVEDSGQRATAAKEPDVRKIRIDGVEYEVSEQVAQAHEKVVSQAAKEREALQAKLDAATASAEKQSARADAAEADAKKQKDALAAATDPKALSARVAARAALEHQGRAVLGEAAKFDGKTDEDVKREVLGKLLPTVKLDGKSEVYIAASFDAAVAKFDAENPGLADAQRAAHGDVDDDAEVVVETPKTTKEKIEKVRKDAREAWRHAPSVGMSKDPVAK